jgi:hypothetical protein
MPTPDQEVATRQRAVPPSWPGTEPEWILYVALSSAGKESGRDFQYMGRSPEGGISFRFRSPPDLGINVAGTMQGFSIGAESSGVNQLTKQQALGLGVYLIFIDDIDLRQDPSYYVEEALRYHDHSHMGG